MGASFAIQCLVVCLLISFGVSIGLGRKQSAGARGKLLCDGKPEKGVLVKLYDDDRGLDLDDFMAKTHTDADGYFELHGTSHEFSSIDPKINNCDDWLPCQRKFSIMLPDSYISSGDRPSRLYEAGTIEMSGKMPGETRDCLH